MRRQKHVAAVLAIASLLALLFAPAQEAVAKQPFTRYAGELVGADLPTAGSLRLQTKHPAEKGLLIRRVDVRVPVSCETGEMTVRLGLPIAGLEAQWAMQGPRRFGFITNVFNDDGNAIYEQFRVGGHIGPTSAHGHAHLLVTDDPHHGDCDSGPMTWSANLKPER